METLRNNDDQIGILVRREGILGRNMYNWAPKAQEYIATSRLEP